MPTGRPCIIDDTTGEPARAVGQRDETLAVGEHADGGQAAEVAMGRGQLEAADEIERAEAAQSPASGR